MTTVSPPKRTSTAPTAASHVAQRAARVAERCARHPWGVLAFALVSSILSGLASAHLPFYTARQALLPKDTEVARRLDSFLTKFGAASDLIVVLEGAPRAELTSFATELAAELRAEPAIGPVTERLDPRFFLEHAYLLIPAERLDRIGSMMTAPGRPLGLDESLQKAMAWLKDGPHGIDLDTAADIAEALSALLEEWQRWLSADEVPTALDWNRVLARHGAEGMADGYFAARDGRMVFLFVRARNASQDFEVLGPFIDRVKAVAGATAAKAGAAGRTVPQVGLTGLPAIEYEEHTAVQKDITLVIGTAAALIGLLILVVVRSVRWALCIFVPMGLGALWGLALASLTVGHLTLMTASFLAILFGLGADYGIFTSSRIAEERRTGKPLVEAIAIGIGSSFRAVLTAGGAAFVIFGALGTVDFPGFAELGVVAAGGVLMILIGTWMVQPALYALLPPKLTAVPKDTTPARVSSRAPRISHYGGHRAWSRPAVVTVIVVAVAGAAGGAVRGFTIPFDYDVLALLPEDSPAAHYQRRMVAESDYQAEVVIFTAADIAEARRITEEAGRLDSIARVQSLTNLFPPDAEARLQKARDIGALAARADYAARIGAIERAGLPDPTFQRVRKLLEQGRDTIEGSQEQAFSAGHATLVERLEQLRGHIEAIRDTIDRDPGGGRERSERFLRALAEAAHTGLQVIDTWRTAEALTPDRLPPALRERFFAADGTVAVYAFPAESVYDPAHLDRLMNEVYGVSERATGFPTTHHVFSKAVVEGFIHGTLLAVIACLIWLILMLRSLTGFVLASLPLLIGGGWMLGAMSLFGLEYNYANIIALPLVIALAVDYGVWFSHRWRELTDRTPIEITLIAGKVIALAAGTELAGLGAISVADYRGVSTMGIDITIGLVCCLMATLLVAPAIAQLLDPRRQA